MKKYCELFRKYKALLILLIYGVGYGYLRLYYFFWGIDIKYYLVLNDIFFLGVEYSAVLAIAFLCCHIFFSMVDVGVNYLIKKCRLVKLRKFFSDKGNIQLTSAILSSIIFLSLLYFCKIIYIEFIKYIRILVIAEALYMGLQGYLYHEILKEKKRAFSRKEKCVAVSLYVPIVLLFIALLIVSIVLNRFVEKSNHIMEFVYEGEHISAESQDVVFVGQTSTYLFIHYPKDSTTVAYPKDHAIGTKLQ